VEGLRKTDSAENVAAKLIVLLRTEDEEMSQQIYENHIWTATSLLISDEVKGAQARQLLRGICWSPVTRFNEATVRAACECWQWILSARRDLVLQFMQEMLAAWQSTVERRIGIFAPSIEPDSPLAAYEGCTLTVELPVITPHEVWVNFICELVENSKSCNDDVVEMFIYLIHRCLPLSIGDRNLLTRSVRALRPRFRLLSCALTMLQNDSSRHSPVKKTVLRERIYSACLDYFCQGYSCPTQDSLDLRKDLHAVLKFWQILHNDKKHIRPFTVDSVLEGNTTKSLTRVGKGNPAFLKETSLTATANEIRFGDGWMNTMYRKQQSNTLPLLKKRKEKYEKDTMKEYIKKRNLILELLAQEVDILATWLNPLGAPELTVSAESTISTWRQMKSSEKTWREQVRLAWDLSPVFAVYLPRRLKSSELSVVGEEVSSLVRNYPEVVMHLPEALNYLATPDVVLNDSPELNNILSWAYCTPIRALSFFSRQYPPHPITAQYAVRSLSSYPADAVLFYIPQLVQAVRHDAMGYVVELIKTISKKSQLVAHQLIWNMQTNIYLDEEGHHKDPEIGDILENLISSIISSLSGSAKHFHEREFSFFEDVTGISGVIRKFPKGPERKEACLKELANVKVRQGCYLPSNPEALVIDIDAKSGTPMQSAAKAPFLARFKVKKCGIHQVEAEGLGEPYQQSPSLNSLGVEMWQAAIFKVGDDVRQDMLALQVIALFKNIFEQVDLDLFLFPYRVVATAPGNGVIECVPNAKSRDQLGRSTDVGLYEYFLKQYGDQDTEAFQVARRNFIKSMAAYSVFGFLLQIKDRHNGNIMLDNEGNIIHIDFGFMFESSPGGNLGFEPDIKLTEEMLLIMGGNVNAPPFKWFMHLCVQAYLAVRPYCESVVSLVSLMLDTGLPCFRGQTIRLLRARFSPQTSERDAANYMISVINNSCLSYRTKTYDMIQFYQNQIPY
jgi:phosphatidylinositol 4-kinase